MFVGGCCIMRRPKAPNAPTTKLYHPRRTWSTTFWTKIKTISSQINHPEVMLMACEFSQCGMKPSLLAQRRFPMRLIFEITGSIMDANGEMLEYWHLMKWLEYAEIWSYSYSDEIGRLTQGMEVRVKGTDTMHFIHKDEVPRDCFKDLTYGKINCNYREGKAEPNKVRLTAEGDRMNYPGDVGTPTSNLLTVKLLLNSIISTSGVDFFTMDTKCFTWILPWQGTNTSDWKFLTCPTRSSKDTTSVIKQQRMDTCTSQFLKECMVYPNHE